jgi:hypothetical protein
MWKSLDAGKTWTHVGLADSRHLPRVRVHPRNADLVYACALGPPLRTQRRARRLPLDATAARPGSVKFVSRDAGCIDLAMDPTNPRVLYASFWNVRRQPWTLERAARLGPVEVDRRRRHLERAHRQPGLPRGTWGISGVAVSPVDPDNVWAIVEAEEGGLFRSRDGGETWKDERRPRHPPARLVLHADLRRHRRRRDRLRPQRALPPLPGRRQELHLDPHAARRQPRPVDRPRRPAAHDRGQRRRRQRLRRRRRDLDRPGQPADGADVPRLDRRRLPLAPAGRPAGQLRRAHPLALGRGGDRRRATGSRPPAARAATSSPSRASPTSSTAAPTAAS